MRTVKEYAAPQIEKELRFKDWCKTREIKFLGLDADDTLWATSPIFSKQMNLCFDFLGREAPVLSREEWKNKIETINNQTFEKMGVNPKKWRFITAEALRPMGVREEIRIRAEEILMEIYKTKPQLLSGTEATLRFLNRCEIEYGKITHAGTSWDKEKDLWTGLNAFFNDKNTFRIDENGHKTKDSWLEALRYFGVEPRNCMIVGDSPRADIIPAQEIGVRERMLVNNPDCSRWSIHDLPINEQTIVVANIGEIINLRN